MAGATFADRIGFSETPGFGLKQKFILGIGSLFFTIGSLTLVVFQKRSVKHERATSGNVVGRVILLVLSTFVTFWVVDFTSIRFFSSRSSLEEHLPYGMIRKPKPYVMFGGTEYGNLESGEVLNRLGYRGKLPSGSKEADEFRIFVLGGSAVFLGDSSIPVLLEKEFRRNGFPNVNVYNFGVVTSVSGMELARILFEVSEFEPDLVIMYNGNNDIEHPCLGDPRPGYPMNFIVYEHNPLLESNIRSYPTMSLLLYGSNIARYLLSPYFVKKFVPLEEVRKEVRYQSEAWKEEIADVYVRNLVRAQQVSNAFGAGFIAFFQPTLYFKDSLSAKENQLVNPVQRDYYLDMRKRILSKIETPVRKERINFVDLSDIYDHVHGRVFEDNVHIRQQGYVIVVREMFRQIVKHVTIRK